MYQTIINPSTGKTEHISHKNGHILLNHYIQSWLMRGGSNTTSLCRQPVGQLPILDVNEMIGPDEETVIYGRDEDLYPFFYNKRHARIDNTTATKLFNTIYCYYSLIKDIPNTEAARKALFFAKNIQEGTANLIDLGITTHDIFDMDELRNNTLFDTALANSVTGQLSEQFLVFSNVWSDHESQLLINGIHTRLGDIGIPEKYRRPMTYEILDFVINNYGWDNQSFKQLLEMYLPPTGTSNIPSKLETGFTSGSSQVRGEQPTLTIPPFIELLHKVPLWSIFIQEEESLSKLYFWEQSFSEMVPSPLRTYLQEVLDHITGETDRLF